MLQGYATLSNFATQGRVARMFPSLFMPWVSISAMWRTLPGVPGN